MTQNEHDQILDHDFDGIRELDNHLPPWWKWLFILSIVFFVAYIFHYHIFKTGDSQSVEFYKEMNPEWSESDLKMVGPSLSYKSPYSGTANVAKVAVSRTDEVSSEPVEIVLLTDSESLSSGKDIFDVNCVACHGANGEGLIGPNLTDKYWIHGGSIKDVVHLINIGVPAKGMISWEKTLTPTQTLAVASYIISLEGTNPPNQKAPEGELFERN